MVSDTRPPVEGSWILEGEDERSDYYPHGDKEGPECEPSARSRRRSSQGQNHSPEPELVMPALDPETMESSWTDARERKSFLKHSRPVERNQDTRRRITRPATSKQSNSAPLSTTNNARDYSDPLDAERDLNQAQHILLAVMHHTKTTLSYVLDVFGGAIRLLKKPIMYLLAVGLLFTMMIWVGNLVASTVQATISPICQLPGASLLNLPFCSLDQASSKRAPRSAAEFEQLIVMQGKFEEVLEQSVGGVTLSFDMKWSESSMRDLRTLVKFSQLPSRNELALEFDGFLDTARIASRDLLKFNSRVGHAVDKVIVVTRWTSQCLDGVQERQSSRGLIGAFVEDTLLAPFQSEKYGERQVLDQYIQHTQIVQEEIGKLIVEAHALLYVLENLEGRLQTIHGLAFRDGASAKEVKEDWLVQLWAFIGGKKSKTAKAAEQLDLLGRVLHCRNSASVQVSETLARLEAMAAGIEDLRDRVAAPEVLSERSDLPLSAHIEVIEKGLERMQEQRLISQKSGEMALERGVKGQTGSGSLLDG